MLKSAYIGIFSFCQPSLYFNYYGAFRPELKELFLWESLISSDKSNAALVKSYGEV